MPEPLDYQSKQKSRVPHPESALTHAPRGARPAIPLDFNVLVTQTSDHAAARAIENEMARVKIAVFRADSGDAIDRVVELFVRESDRARAEEIASRLFARRKKVKAFPKSSPASDSWVRDPGDFLGGF